jgi:hypothetical protein
MPCAVVSWGLVGAAGGRDGNKADTQGVSGNLRIRVSGTGRRIGPLGTVDTKVSGQARFGALGKIARREWPVAACLWRCAHHEHGARFDRDGAYSL